MSIRAKTWLAAALGCGVLIVAGCQSGEKMLNSAVGGVQQAVSRVTGNDSDDSTKSNNAHRPPATKPLPGPSQDSTELASFQIPKAPAPASRPTEAGPAATQSENLPGGRVGVLVRALGDPDPQLRREAAEMLGQLGQAAKEAEPALRRAQQADADPAVRAAAGEALKSIGAQ